MFHSSTLSTKIAPVHDMIAAELVCEYTIAALMLIEHLTYSSPLAEIIEG